MRRAPALMPVRILAVAAALTAAFAAGDAAWGQAAPIGPNYSSHAAPFFEGLLAGRVWVLERPNARRADDRGTVWGTMPGELVGADTAGGRPARPPVEPAEAMPPGRRRPCSGRSRAGAVARACRGGTLREVLAPLGRAGRGRGAADRAAAEFLTLTAAIACAI